MKRYYFYGTGAGARRSWPYFSWIHNWEGFIDSDPSKVGGLFMAKRVFSVEEIAGLPGLKIIYIASQYCDEIEKQLLALNIPGADLRKVPSIFLYKFSTQLYITWVRILTKIGTVFRVQNLRNSFHNITVISKLRKNNLIIGSNRELYKEVMRIKKIKRAEVLYILGAGPSILDLTKNDFEVISKGISVGLNGFAYFNFCTDVLAFEYPHKIPEMKRSTREFSEFLCDPDFKSQRLLILKDVNRIDYDSLYSLRSKGCRLYSVWLEYIPFWGLIDAKFYTKRLYAAFTFAQKMLL